VTHSHTNLGFFFLPKCAALLSGWEFLSNITANICGGRRREVAGSNYKYQEAKTIEMQQVTPGPFTKMLSSTSG
jgi:hypothetical protein